MRPPARILHLITRLELGGAQHNTLYTVAHLDRDQFRPGLGWGPGDVLDGRAGALTEVDLFPVPALVREVRPPRDVAAVSALRRVMRDFRPDVVHTHSSKAGILGRLAARLEGAQRVVHSVHGFGFTPLQPAPLRALFLCLERLAARWTDHFVAVSRRNAEQGVALGVFEPDQVTVIRSGIRLEGRGGGDDAVLRTRLSLPPDAPLVTQVANFKPQKAPLDFVRVAAAVARRQPGAVFVMAGDGPLRPRAEALAARLGIAQRVRFVGWLDDPEPLIAASRVVVLTSRHEGLPRVVVEALASGVPVVATAVDGTTEVVRHDGNGMLAPPGDVAALADGVVALLADEARWHRLAAAARQGLEEFDIDGMVRRQEELYRWLLGCTAR